MILKPNSIIAVDFDGTCVTHEFPNVGRDIGAVPVLKRLTAEGHRLILWTMRAFHEGGMLPDAIEWFEKNGIRLWAINDNPEQRSWAPSSRKVFANHYIDDMAVGTPLIIDSPTGRPYVDWKKMEVLLFGEVASTPRNKLI